MWANIIIGGVNGKGVTRSRLRGMQPISTIDGGRVGSRPMLSEWGPVTWPVVDKIGPPTEREGRKYTDGVVVTVEHWEGISVEYARWFHRTRGTKIEDYKVSMPGSISTKVSRLRRGEQPPGIGDTQRRIISRPKENNNTRINNSVQQSSTPTVRTQVWDRRIELANPVRKKRRTKVLSVPTQKKITVALGMPRAEAREAFRKHTARLRAIEKTTPQKSTKKLHIPTNRITAYFTPHTNDTTCNDDKHQHKEKYSSTSNSERGRVTLFQARKATKVAGKVACVAANYATFTATLVANTLATLAAIAVAGYATRTAELAEKQVLNMNNGVTRPQKRKSRVKSTNQERERIMVTVTAKSGTESGKRTKLTPMHACTITRTNSTPPTSTNRPATAKYTISTGRGSKHCRDYAIADRKGKKGKRRDSD